MTRLWVGTTLATSARKSLGEKRREASDAQILRLCGNFDQQLSDEDEARVKIFPNESFGFVRITVERPLRLRWEITDASADALLADKKLAKLDKQQLEGLVERARGRSKGANRTAAGPADAEDL